MGYFDRVVPEAWRWFPESRFGLFIHWGPYAVYGRGEQVLFREHLDPAEYEARACEWNPRHFDAALWADIAKRAGFRYACLTARHHDGYCLWDSRYTDYTSARQAPRRDFVREYVEAFRAAGLRVGLYYSWIDWRIPAYFDGPEKDPAGWARMRAYLHHQVEELLTRYGRIDYFFFDGAWPRDADELESPELVAKMRAWQPGILINNRLGRTAVPKPSTDGGEGPGGAEALGDFGTPEHQIKAEQRLWESCQVSTWRLWGYAAGERWRPADLLLDMLCECAEKGGNLILNVGPTADGEFPPEFVERALAIGRWLEIHGEAIYGTEGGDITEFITRGRQTVKGNNLYLIFRFWDGQPELRLADLVTPVKRAVLLTTGQELPFEQRGEVLFLRGLPVERPTALFPVIKLECDGRPAANQWGRERLWGGDPARVAEWARRRGTSVWVGGEERE
ncbi:MAG TPA: alpha-L-fucosidase [Limnochordia bacterium]